MIAPLERLATNPLIRPSDISFVKASGTFNPGVTVHRASDKVVLLVRIFEEASRRSLLGLALSADGKRIDEIWDRPAVARDASYEQWGVEDARITYLEKESRYAITYTGYSRDGPRVCLITTDDLLSPTSYRRHGPRIAGENKNCVILPEKIDRKYVIIHRPMPRMCASKSLRSRRSGRRAEYRSSARSRIRGGAPGSVRGRRRYALRSAGCCRSTAQPPLTKGTSTRWDGACST